MIDRITQKIGEKVGISNPMLLEAIRGVVEHELELFADGLTDRAHVMTQIAQKELGPEHAAAREHLQTRSETLREVARKLTEDAIPF